MKPIMERRGFKYNMERNSFWKDSSRGVAGPLQISSVKWNGKNLIVENKYFKKRDVRKYA